MWPMATWPMTEASPVPSTSIPTLRSGAWGTSCQTRPHHVDRARIGLTLLVASLGLVVGTPAAQADPPVCTSFGPAGECLLSA
jgi:hypothetical protein